MVASRVTFAVVSAFVWTGCVKARPPAVTPSVGEPREVATSPADGNQPEYWAKKLDDRAERATAVSRLDEMFGGVVTRSNHDRTAPEVRSFVNATLPPLVELYVREYEHLDLKTRVAVIRLLADYRDVRTAPALEKAFEAFARTLPTSRDETDIKWAARAQEELRIESVSMPLLQAFLKLRASSLLGSIAYRDVHQAVINQPPNEAWVQPLIATLAVTIEPVVGKDTKSVDEARDQIFWQMTAAEALGRIGNARAVEPLFAMLLDPTKADVSYTAGLALVRLGRPTVDIAIKLLKSEHEKLQTFQARRIKDVTGNEPKNKPWAFSAAKVLGASGRPEAIAPLIAALNAERDDELKQLLVVELTRIHGTRESKEAFKKAFRRASLQAQPELAVAMSRFMDPDLVPWTLETALKLGGPKSDREAAQGQLLETALKLAKPSQMERVKAAARELGAHGAMELAVKIEPLVARCRDDAFCYLDALKSAENQSESNKVIGVKAGYMVGILGDEKLRDELIESLGLITNPTLRHVSAQSIDFLTPAGSHHIAQKLRTIVEANAKSPDRDKAAGDQSLKQVMIRLGARAS